jgi:hypothetical protein
MNIYTIEVDEIIMNYLKQNAEPFVDTPSTVLHKLLFGTSKISEFSKPISPSLDRKTPKALSQILEVIREVVENGHTRPKATIIVAVRNGTAPQTIIDKYCRQLGKTATEVDMLFGEPGLEEFRLILNNKFANHHDVIAHFFNGLRQGRGDMEQTYKNDSHSIKPILKCNKTCGSASDRKKRDTALESALKHALGERLEGKFGFFTLEGQSQLVFNDARVLCKFSSFHDDQFRWFWGVSGIYWQNWRPTDYLALIMENKDRKGYSYVMLESEEAQSLFNACSESGGEKKINMRIYADDNVARFQEWKEFDATIRTQKIDILINDSHMGRNSDHDLSTHGKTDHESFLKTPILGEMTMYSFRELKLMDIGKRTRPQGLRFDDVQFLVSDWSDLWVQLLNHLLRTGKLRKEHLPIFSSSSRREKYLINTIPKHFFPEKDGNWKQVGDLYVDVKYNADAHLKNLVHLFEEMGISNDDLAISFK